MENLNIPQIKPSNESSQINMGNMEKIVKPVFMDIEENSEKIKKLPDLPKPQSILKKRKYQRIIFLVILVFLLINGLFVFNIFLKSKKLIASGKKIKESVNSQKFSDFKSAVGGTEKEFLKFSNSYKLISWMKIIPFLGKYVSDGSHAINAVKAGFEVTKVLMVVAEPYADLIGFSASETTDGGKTASERMDFMVKALPEVLPKLDEISLRMDTINTEISKINPKRYPVTISKKPVREKLEKGLDMVFTTTKMIKDGKPVLEQMPYLLGMDSPRTFLVIFQNDKELRPTGGFITAYSVMKVQNAKFEPVASDDIYNLDTKYQPSIPAPDPIIEYIKGPYVLSKKLKLRDMNWDPDFPSSMKLFTEEIKKVGLDKIDGVIAVDTQVLVYLLDVLGPIGVPGFGNFSNEIQKKCNCPQVIYELEDFADTEGPVVWDPAGTGKIIYAPPNMDNRKKIIGPLMNSILANAFAQPKNKLPALTEAIYKSLMEKHVLLYLNSEEVQKAAEGFGIAGNLSKFDKDYLFIDDANLGGRKSNLYVTQEVTQEFSLTKDQKVEKTVTIVYKNPEKYDGWLNSVLPNWLRIYVPKGSELLSFEGVDNRSEVYEEHEKTVFAGHFELRPQGVVKVILKYRLPFKVKSKDALPLYIQKQPGTNAPLYQLLVGKKTEEFFLKTDKEIKIQL